MSPLLRPLLAIPSGCNFFSPLLLAPRGTHPNLTYLVSLSSIASTVTGPFLIFSEGHKFSLLSAGIGFDPSYTISHFHLMPSFFTHPFSIFWVSPMQCQVLGLREESLVLAKNSYFFVSFIKYFSSIISIWFFFRVSVSLVKYSICLLILFLSSLNCL